MIVCKVATLWVTAGCTAAEECVCTALSTASMMTEATALVYVQITATAVAADSTAVLILSVGSVTS